MGPHCHVTHHVIMMWIVLGAVRCNLTTNDVVIAHDMKYQVMFMWYQNVVGFIQVLIQTGAVSYLHMLQMDVAHHVIIVVVQKQSKLVVLQHLMRPSAARRQLSQRIGAALQHFVITAQPLRSVVTRCMMKHSAV